MKISIKLKSLVYGVLIGLCLPLITIITVFLLLRPAQLASLTIAYGSIPLVATGIYWGEALRQNDYEEAVKLLQKQKHLSLLLGMNKTMRRHLYERTFELYDRIDRHQDYAKLAEWVSELEQVLEAYPIYWAELMSSHVRSETEPQNTALLMKNVIDYLPAYDRAYRPVIRNTTRQGQVNDLSAACEMYRQSPYVFLALDPYYRNRYGKLKYDGLITLIANNYADPWEISRPAAISNSYVRYEFQMPGLPYQTELKLASRPLPGVRMYLDSIEFRTVDSVSIYKRSDLYFFGEKGFVMDDGSYLFSTDLKVDVVTFLPKAGTFPPSDQVTLNLKFGKLALSNDPACK